MSQANVSGIARIHSPVWPIAAASDEPPTFGAIFASGEHRAVVLAAKQAAGHAIVAVRPSPLLRGRLFEAIEDACDGLITAAHGPPSGLGAYGTHVERLRDRLFRAHRVGRAGLVIALGPLAPLAFGQGALAPEDGEAIRVLASIDGPFSLLLEESDRSLGVFRAPVPLAALLGEPEPAALPTPAPARPAVHTADLAKVDHDGDDSDSDSDSDHDRNGDGDHDRDHDGDLVACAAAVVSDPRAEESVEHVFLPVAKVDEAARVVERPATLPPRETPWRAHAAALTTARGPQPLSEFERLFTEHYMPLMTALEQGHADGRARRVAEEFRHTFARSYSEAFPTFLVTGRRPRLVMDAPEVAGRIARLHGARSVQLLLVDGMRFDVGTLVRDALIVGLGPQATLAEETFLMAALPSNTPRQLSELARGLEGLRAPLSDANEGEVVGGRTSEVVRRVRIGGRDIFKLDVVEARLREADDVSLLLPEIARRASDAIVRHASTLAPRTLLFVFADHGFSIDGAGEVHQGGASPEEVLVPAFAFLLGMVQ